MAEFLDYLKSIPERFDQTFSSDRPGVAAVNEMLYALGKLDAGAIGPLAVGSTLPSYGRRLQRLFKIRPEASYNTAAGVSLREGIPEYAGWPKWLKPGPDAKLPVSAVPEDLLDFAKGMARSPYDSTYYPRELVMRRLESHQGLKNIDKELKDMSRAVLDELKAEDPKYRISLPVTSPQRLTVSKKVADMMWKAYTGRGLQ